MIGRRIVVGCWLVGLGVLTNQRVTVWQSEVSLWTEAVLRAPLKPRPHINLGRAYDLLGVSDRAEHEYLLTTSLTLDPRRAARLQLFSRVAAETNLAHLRMQAGQAATAMKILDQVLTEWPGFPYAEYNRSLILSAVGACQLAARSYQVTRNFPMLAFPTAAPCVSEE